MARRKSKKESDRNKTYLDEMEEFYEGINKRFDNKPSIIYYVSAKMRKSKKIFSLAICANFSVFFFSLIWQILFGVTDNDSYSGSNAFWSDYVCVLQGDFVWSGRYG